MRIVMMGTGTFAEPTFEALLSAFPEGVVGLFTQPEREGVKQRGLNVFARIDHAAGAAMAGKTLRPTELLIFGNPQAGTPLMQCSQRVGIDLPVKALVWADEAGQTWLGYNDPRWTMHRHGVRDCPAAEQIGKALSGIAQETVAR